MNAMAALGDFEKIKRGLGLAFSLAKYKNLNIMRTKRAS